jgi:hypothetical protein
VITEAEKREMLESIAKMEALVAKIQKCDANIARMLDLSKPLTDADKARLKELE